MGFAGIVTDSGKGRHYAATTAATTTRDSGGNACEALLVCLLDIVRALRMGSCLSSEGSGSPRAASPPPTTSPASAKSLRRRRLAAARWDDLSAQLHQIPGRMFLNGASGVASMFTQKGTKGINQDAMIVWENFSSMKDSVFCGVFDGHGPHGHLVSRRVRDLLPLKLRIQHPEANLCADDREEGAITDVESLSSHERSSLLSDEEERHQDVSAALRERFLKAFKIMDEELMLHPSIDSYSSGTTAVTLLKQGQDLVIGNVGDSRAVLGTRDHNDCLVAVQLTVDLKPNLPREAERIQRCRGRVFALQDEPEVARVWMPDIDSPGLAMARALGDFCLKDFGLISMPEMYFRRLTEKDEFVVLATDGVWDVLSNKEVVGIVAAAPSRSTAARHLVQSAVRAWKLKYPTSKVDDCAVVCLFLEPDASTAYYDIKIVEAAANPLGTTGASYLHGA